MIDFLFNTQSLLCGQNIIIGVLLILYTLCWYQVFSDAVSLYKKGQLTYFNLGDEFYVSKTTVVVIFIHTLVLIVMIVFSILYSIIALWTWCPN
jgi:hypothetical protein